MGKPKLTRSILIKITLTSLCVLIVGALTLTVDFLFSNAPILIASETVGGAIHEYPQVMLMPNRTVYIKFISGDKILVDHYRIDENQFQEISSAIVKIPNGTKSHYVFDLSFDAPDLAIYFRNQHGEYSSYIYPMSISPDDLAPAYLNRIKTKLQEISSPAFVQVISDIPILRKENNYQGNTLDYIIFEYWKRKLPTEYIEDIRQRGEKAVELE